MGPSGVMVLRAGRRRVGHLECLVDAVELRKNEFAIAVFLLAPSSGLPPGWQPSGISLPCVWRTTISTGNSFVNDHETGPVHHKKTGWVHSHLFGASGGAQTAAAAAAGRQLGGCIAVPAIPSGYASMSAWFVCHRMLWLHVKGKWEGNEGRRVSAGLCGCGPSV